MEPGTPQSLEAQVWDCLEQGNIQQAIAACERLNREHPEFESGWHTASQLALKLGNAAMALDAIREALRMRPDHTPWLIQQGRCLARLGRMDDVAGLADRLVDTRVNSPYECAALGMLLTDLGRRDDALKFYELAAEKQPEDGRHHYNIASLQRTLGQLEAAERNFSKAVSLNPGDYEAYKLRSELQAWTADNNHVAELEGVLAQGIADKRGEANICYALAKEFEDLGESGKSFAALDRGASARRSNMQYSPGRDLETITAIRETFTADLFRDVRQGDDSAEPNFVLGMPRTGTTLVERILANHSDVFAAGELPNFAVQLMNQVREKAGGAKVARDELVQLSADIDYARLGADYIRSTRPFTGHTGRFIDKLPLNYLYIGLIHLALPNAKIINVRRDPMDTCYAVYKALFADAYPFSYDLEELANYYVAYHQLMDHWYEVLPNVICRVDYEHLVGDVEPESRRLVQHCDLPWQSQCLKFYESSDASTTASTVQVRQPVYKTSIGRWKDYEDQLQPVAGILRQAGII